MYNIDVCYKFIFGSMFEEMVLDDIAQKVYEYTRAGVFFVSCSGEILAYSCGKEERKACSLKKGCLTFEDYKRIFDDTVSGKNQNLIFPVYHLKRALGYVVLTHINTEQQTFFRELGRILVQISQEFFEEKGKNTFFHLPLKEQVICRTIFAEKQCHKILADILEGNYIIIIFPKEDIIQKIDYLTINQAWKHLYVYEEEAYITAVLYKVNDQKAQDVYNRIANINLSCCISEMFGDLDVCRAKQDFLKHIMSIRRQEDVGMKREKDWYMEGLFTYTSPLIKDAGLNDYSISCLIEEDKKNNTEFYHTLKMYLLCENNITIAAKKLYIHRNTMVYRLKQIKSCIGLDINDGDISRGLLAFMMMHDAAEGQGNKQ